MRLSLNRREQAPKYKGSRERNKTHHTLTVMYTQTLQQHRPALPPAASSAQPYRPPAGCPPAAACAASLRSSAAPACSAIIRRCCTVAASCSIFSFSSSTLRLQKSTPLATSRCGRAGVESEGARQAASPD